MSPVVANREKAKSIGNSITLPIDISNIDKLESVLLSLVEQVTYRLRKENLFASTISIQLRTKDFNDISHQSKLDFSTSDTKKIFSKTKELFREMYKQNVPIRLIGFRVDKLVDKENQLSLFDNNKLENNKLDTTLDFIKSKFGYNSIAKAGELEMNEIFRR